MRLGLLVIVLLVALGINGCTVHGPVSIARPEPGTGNKTTSLASRVLADIAIERVTGKRPTTIYSID